MSYLIPTPQEKKIFQIPWMHAARHGWDVEKDAPLFRNWAIHTGMETYFYWGGFLLNFSIFLIDTTFCFAVLFDQTH